MAVAELAFAKQPHRGGTVHATFYWYVHGGWHNRRYLLAAADL